MGSSSAEYPDSLVLAFIFRESRGQVDALNEGTNATGIMQITEINLKDAQNHGFDSSADLQDMFNPKNALKVFFHVMEKYSHLHQYNTQKMGILHFGGAGTLSDYNKKLRETTYRQANQWLDNNHPKTNCYRIAIPALKNQIDDALRGDQKFGVVAKGGTQLDAPQASSDDLGLADFTFVPSIDVRSYGFEYGLRDALSDALSEIGDGIDETLGIDAGTPKTKQSSRGYNTKEPTSSSNVEPIDVSPSNKVDKSVQLYINKTGFQGGSPVDDKKVRQYLSAYQEGSGFIRRFSLQLKKQTPKDMQWPLRQYHLPSDGNRSFGDERETRDFHFGVDLVPEPGLLRGDTAPVYALAPGKVIKKENKSDRYGKVIYVEHGDGVLSTRYGHLSSVLVSEGDEIELNDLGDPIAKTGTSASSGGFEDSPIGVPHIHFEVRFNSKGLRGETVGESNTGDTFTLAVNPMPVLRNLRSPSAVITADTRVDRQFQKTYSDIEQELASTQEKTARQSLKEKRDKAKAQERALSMAKSDRSDNYEAQSEKKSNSV